MNASRCLTDSREESGNSFQSTQTSGPKHKYQSTTTCNLISFVVAKVYLNQHHVVSVQQDTSSLESLEQRRDNVSAFRLVEVDDLVTNLCDICQRVVRDEGDPKEQDKRTLASKPKLLVHLLVRARSTPCREPELLMRIPFPPNGLQNHNQCS